jgi:peptide/nickel transport system ATP-binding protein
VIIADEPTTALDVTVQAQVLETLNTARRETGAALVLITHDLGVVAGQAERVLVMYAGRLVEKGTADELYYTPRMPYTLGLLGSVPRMDQPRGERLTPIVGSPPSLVNQPPGCPFSARCPLAQDICEREEPPLESTTSQGHLAACHFSEQLENAVPGDYFKPTSAGEDGEASIIAQRSDGVQDTLSVRNLVKHFPIKGKGVIRRTTGQVHAVCGVSFDLPPHQTLGLVGESGCGKTTTARTLLGLDQASSGEVTYSGRNLVGLSTKKMRALRGDLQIVFQDPYASLDPRMPVNEIITEPLKIHGLYDDGGRDRVRELLRTVGLKPEHGNRYPHEFSGGQRQRIGVARALALQPKILVLDEPVSALDVSIQAGVLNLLQELQEKMGLSYLFVSHDLSVVRHIADRIAVMYLGHIVETGPADQVFSAPAHPYTQALISAIPLPDPHKERTRERIVIQGDVPSPVSTPSGCRFRTRCPKFANVLTDAQRTRCVDEEPELTERGQGWPNACHYAESASLL